MKENSSKIIQLLLKYITYNTISQTIITSDSSYAVLYNRNVKNNFIIEVDTIVYNL
jgi:hypothetical protein